jgi:polar amino acid transport system substrate-binding protein
VLKTTIPGRKTRNMRNITTRAFPVLFALLLTASLMPLVHARDLKIGVGNFPPYFSEKGNTGLFTDLIFETFKLMPQHQLKALVPMSNYRLIVELNEGRVDGSANIFADAKITGCRTDPIFRYSDVAVSRKDRNLDIYAIADLKGKSIITYQGAHTFLGKPFQQVTSPEPAMYREVSQPADQARLLASGKFDVSVGDMYIFLNSVQTWSDARYKTDHFEIHRLFPDIYSHMAFQDQALCDEFNVALRTIKKNGRYEAVYAQYLDKLSRR